MNDHELTHLLLSLYDERETKVRSLISGDFTLEEKAEMRQEVDEIEKQIITLCGYK